MASQAAPQPMPGNIYLAHVIDWSVQRTYHELTVLSELLPRKTDMERKIEIVQFAHRTRQLFVRLLSLVKWAKNGCKIDKCMAISNYLDQQAMLHTETANQLSKMARETLVHARLPAFAIPVAVDVLTSGTYPRLPTCIRDKIIPADPITSEEEEATLKRLTQIIEYRLVTSDIPRKFKNLTVYNGRVRVVVENEFEASLTLMDDGPQQPWRLLNIDILVEDINSRDGKPLVHPQQVQYIRELVQSRLLDTDTPLHELYFVLHSFCQSLQLEVLFTQAQKLIHEQLNGTISIDQYVPCKKLTISYWRPRNNPAAAAKTTPWPYRLEIYVCESDPYRPLLINHYPPQPSADVKLPHKLKSNQLSLEKILLETVHTWSNVRLGELQKRMESLRCASNFMISDLPPTLSFRLLQPCMNSELTRITLDCQQGVYRVSLAQQCGKLKALTDLQAFLNSPPEQQKADHLKELLISIRLFLATQRCLLSIQYFRTLCLESLPLVQNNNHPLCTLGKNLLFIKVPLNDHLYVVVNLTVTDNDRLSVSHSYYLLPVTATTYTPEDTQTEIQQMFLVPGPLTRIDQHALLHSRSLSVLQETESNTEELSCHEAINARKASSCYFVSEILRVVGQCEQRTAFGTLAEELLKHGILHQGIQEEESGSPCKITLVRLPSPNGEADELLLCLLQCTFRVNVVTMNMMWTVEMLFSRDPLQAPDSPPTSHQCILSYDMKCGRNAAATAEEFIKDWTGIVKLFNMCLEYRAFLEENKQPVALYEYAYKSVSFCYGPDRSFLVCLSWNCQSRSYDATFSVLDTKVGGSNPHNLTRQFLQPLINNAGATLSQFMQVLCDTLSPLAAIQNVPELAIFGLQHQMRTVPTPSFAVLVQSATFIKLCYRQIYLLEITLCDNKTVMIRDGVYGAFESQEPVSGYCAIQGLKVFLAQYIEEQQFQRSQSMAEDENPPTPNNLPVLDTLEALLTGGRPNSPRMSVPSPRQHAPVPSPAVAPSPIGGFGSVDSSLDIQMTPPTLPLPSPAGGAMQSPASNQIAASPGMSFHNQGTPQGMDVSGGQVLGFPVPSPKGWQNSPGTVHINAMSPRAVNFPAGASPRPDYMASGLHQAVHMMPMRSGVSSLPTMLSHAALQKILMPSEDYESNSMTVIRTSALERFLGSALLRRHLSRVLSSEKEIKDKVNMLPVPNEPGGAIAAWTLDTLQFKVAMSNNSQTLQLTVQPLPEHIDKWTNQDMTLLENYFSVVVVCPPYRLHNVLAFCRMISAPVRVVRDFVQIIKRQLYPDMNARWKVEWCLTLPSEINRRGVDLEAGAAAMLVQNNKIFFVLRFIKNSAGGMDAGGLSTLAIPFLYDVNTETLQVVDKQPNIPSPPIQAVQSIIQNTRPMDHYQQQQHTVILLACIDILNQLYV